MRSLRPMYASKKLRFLHLCRPGSKKRRMLFAERYRKHNRILERHIPLATAGVSALALQWQILAEQLKAIHEQQLARQEWYLAMYPSCKSGKDITTVLNFVSSLIVMAERWADNYLSDSVVLKKELIRTARECMFDLAKEDKKGEVPQGEEKGTPGAVGVEGGV